MIGQTLKFTVPNDATVAEAYDVDYLLYGVAFGVTPNRFILRGIFGLNATTGTAPKKWLRLSAKFSRQTWQHGNYNGVDARGTLRNGRRWRYFGHFTESIEYYDVPADVAAYFDQILDTVCFNAWSKRDEFRVAINTVFEDFDRTLYHYRP